MKSRRKRWWRLREGAGSQKPERGCGSGSEQRMRTTSCTPMLSCDPSKQSKTSCGGAALLSTALCAKVTVTQRVHLREQLNSNLDALGRDETRRGGTLLRTNVATRVALIANCSVDLVLDTTACACSCRCLALCFRCCTGLHQRPRQSTALGPQILVLGDNGTGGP